MFSPDFASLFAAQRYPDGWTIYRVANLDGVHQYIRHSADLALMIGMVGLDMIEEMRRTAAEHGRELDVSQIVWEVRQEIHA